MAEKDLAVELWEEEKEEEEESKENPAVPAEEAKKKKAPAAPHPRQLSSAQDNGLPTTTSCKPLLPQSLSLHSSLPALSLLGK